MDAPHVAAKAFPEHQEVVAQVLRESGEEVGGRRLVDTGRSGAQKGGVRGGIGMEGIDVV